MVKRTTKPAWENRSGHVVLEKTKSGYWVRSDSLRDADDLRELAEAIADALREESRLLKSED